MRLLYKVYEMKEYERKYWANHSRLEWAFMIFFNIFLILSGFYLLMTSVTFIQTFIGGVLEVFFSIELVLYYGKLMTVLEEYSAMWELENEG